MSEDDVPSSHGWGMSEDDVPSSHGWGMSEDDVPSSHGWGMSCLFYTSYPADDADCVNLLVYLIHISNILLTI